MLSFRSQALRPMAKLRHLPATAKLQMLTGGPWPLVSGIWNYSRNPQRYGRNGIRITLADRE